MQEALKFLSDCGIFYLATTEGDQPRVRPLGFVMEYEGKLMFCTNNTKRMYKQMKENPKVEISGALADGSTLRICGKVGFCSTVEAKKKALEVMPSLSKMYSPEDGIFEIFYLDEAIATYQGGKGEKRTVSL